MTRKVIIELPYMPPAVLRGNGRPAHWAITHKAAEAFKEAVYWRLVEQVGVEPEPMARAKLTYTVYWCGKPIDRSGLVHGMKYAEDALTPSSVHWRNGVPVTKSWGIGLVVDDNPLVIDGPHVRYVRVKHRDEVKLVMEVEELDAHD